MRKPLLVPGRARNAFFHYVYTPVSSDTVRPLVAYVLGDGRAVDWLYDGIILDDPGLGGTPAPGKDDFDYEAAHQVNRDAVNNFEPRLFDPPLRPRGRSPGTSLLVSLADIVKELRQTLERPKYTLAVTISIPTLHFTDAATVTQTIDRLITRFALIGRDELRLTGFYWPRTEGLPTLLDPDFGTAGRPRWERWTRSFHENEANLVRAAGRHIHAQDQPFEFIWVPCCDYPFKAWSDIFDRVVIQPNIAFSSERHFEGAEQYRTTLQLAGVEFEFGAVTHDGAPRNSRLVGPNYELESARAYITAANAFHWSKNDLTVTYPGSAVQEYSGRPMFREIYDGLFRAMWGPSTVLDPIAIRPAADTFVDRPKAVHGSEPVLQVGGRAGSATYLRFDLPADIPELFAAKLLLTVDSVQPELPQRASDATYDILLQWVDFRPAFDEATFDVTSSPTPVTMEHQAIGARSLVQHLGSYRCVHPGQYAIDVTDVIQRTRSMGVTSVTFRIRYPSVTLNRYRLLTMPARPSPRCPQLLLIVDKRAPWREQLRRPVTRPWNAASDAFNRFGRAERHVPRRRADGAPHRKGR